MLLLNRGGRVRPSFFTRNQKLNVVLAVALAVGSVANGVAPAAAQGFFRQRGRQFPAPRPRPQRFNPPRRPNRPKVDPVVLELLKKMIRPTADYAGEQVTQTTANGGRVSQQRISGDVKGRIRLDYAAPAGLAGDVMTWGPGQFYYLHSKRNTLDIALWPTESGAFGRRELKDIQSGRTQAALVGSETIAGRDAAIVEIDSPERSKKFWIDKETGVQLKVENSGANGLISRTYLTAVRLGPTAGVTDKTFARPNQKGLNINSLFPNSARYDTLASAAPHLPFAPLVPVPPPAGFQLSGVWVFGMEDNRPGNESILLRYSDGVGNFSLFEKRSPRPPAPPKNPNAPRRYRGSMARWEIALPAGGSAGVTYIGHLTPDQLGLLHDSLR